jgi:serine/threonine-protein kinase
MGMTESSIRPEPGLLIAGRYELVSELGRGGMGAVWAARDRVEPRTVAVKFQKGALEAGGERRFAREADALCRLSCPHVVRFLYAGRERGLSYIVMEHLLGHTLRRRMEMSRHLNPHEVVPVIWQAAIGLGSAHRAGIVHRDVKPSNLFMTVENGQDCLKVIDFGIAKGRGLSLSTAGSGAVGSPGYMSPEQALGERVDHRSDVWALGVVAFAALCGKEPFTAESVPATLDRIMRGQARQITRERADLPPALDAFFARAFVHDPAHRFQSASELAVHFERACQGVALEPPGRLSKTKSLAPSVPRPAVLSPSQPPPRSSDPAPSYPPTPASYPPTPASYPPTPASYPPAPAHTPSTRPQPISVQASRSSARPSDPPSVQVVSLPASRRPAERAPINAARSPLSPWLLFALAGLATSLLLLIVWAAQR